MTIRIDKVSATNALASIKNIEETAILNGQVVQKGDYIEGDVFGATAIKDVTSADLLIHASVDDKGKCEKDFQLVGDKIGRTYYPVTGQVFTLPKTMFEGAVAVKDLVEPQVESTKWKKVATDPAAKVYAKVIAEEVFAGQECLVLHIYA